MSSREEMEDRVTEALRASFKPEFLNRIDEIIIFHNLTQEQIGNIVDIQMKRLEPRLAEMNMELVLSDNAREFLAEKGFDQIYGARPLKRAIQKYIENPLSMEILQGNISEGTKLIADVERDRIVFNPV
jgi:ATP-dependent Clp protease ATP-binding subunit ClpB